MYLEDVHLILRQDENSKTALQSFITKTEKVFSFPALNENHLREDLWNSLYAISNNTSDQLVRANCCKAVRILSREKINLDKILEETDWLNLLKSFSGLENSNIEYIKENKITAVEALKCLCNLAFNSIKAAEQCAKNDVLYNINERMKSHSNPLFPEEIKCFDARLMFIITALCPETQSILREQKDAVYNLMISLEHTVTDKNFPQEGQVNLASEILKTLFNLTVQLEPKEDQKELYIKLMGILKMCLLLPVEQENTDSLQNNVVNLLTNIPNSFYVELITPKCGNEEHLEYDMSAFEAILEILKTKVAAENPINRQHEIISPTATVLYKGACANRHIRKYLRSQILPPLKDFQSRPEVGTTLRNCLCRLLTSPITQLKQIIEELLFVLCKKSVKRMIKYTGYGNAAGLLAQRGLLGGKEDKEAAEFSSDSEDSETEEYADNKHNINPVLGCYEPEHPNPMDSMTDEQKEYEMMKLINIMDALTRQGSIKPCRIDENGKPVPIEHVLELQDSLNKKENCRITEED